MESVIITICCVAVLVYGGLSVCNDLLWTTDRAGTAWKEMDDAFGEVRRTGISSNDALATCSGTHVFVVFENDGSRKLADFDKWDMIIQYADSSGTPAWTVTRLNYNSGTPGVLDDNEWIVEGIYLDAGAATAEAFDPGILNPGEDLKIQIQVNPTVGAGQSGTVTASTPVGVTDGAGFTN